MTVEKMIGCIFGREQYKKNDGKLAFATKIFNVRNVNTIRAGVEAPPDKLLEQEFDAMAYYQGMAKLGEEIVFDENEIPF